MEKEEIDFLKEKEEKMNGKITFRSFATWFASNTGIIREHGVIFYKIKDVCYYEDFEHRNTILGIPMPETKWEKENPYKKYESCFEIANVASIFQVKQSLARKIAELGLTTPSPKANMVDKVISKLVTQIVLNTGEILFMELIDYKKLENLVSNT